MSDTGLEMELLQKYLFIPLDIFQERQQNESIKDKRDAWLTLFSSDDPDRIILLITAYPEFRKIYEEAYTICLNIERVMGMFSEELAILDRNTVKYMMDEMQNEIDEQKHTIEAQSQAIEEQNQTIEEQNQSIEAQKHTIERIQQKYNDDLAESLKNTIDILRSLELSEEEIITRICDKYHMQAEQVTRYL